MPWHWSCPKILNSQSSNDARFWQSSSTIDCCSRFTGRSDIAEDATNYTTDCDVIYRRVVA